jgi:hypothetical protein
MQAKIAGSRGGRRSAKKRKSKRTSAAKSAVKRVRRSAKRGRAVLKKGSQAAKAWGRKMKRLRRK